MGRIAAIGAEAEVRGFGLAGVLVLPAEDDESARAAWRALPADVALVILGPGAAAAVDPPVGTGTAPIVAVIPR
jgi:vacuolar-type H+-ATPase subunit F/Vma7